MMVWPVPVTREHDNERTFRLHNVEEFLTSQTTTSPIKKVSCVMSDLHREVHDNRALLGHYAESSV